MADDPGRGGDADDEAREMREHEQEARERDDDERGPSKRAGAQSEETTDMPGMED